MSLVILDFGSQYTQLIARRIRQMGYYAEILPYNAKPGSNVKGVILSGSPFSVYEKNAPKPDNSIYELNVPILGICYGMQLVAEKFEGKVAWFRVPESIKFIINGKRNKWVGGKDFILKIIGTIGVDGALYKSMEFCGSAISELPMDDRMTMCNMAIEAGGKNGIIEADETTINYLKERNIADYEILKSDEDAQYVKIYEFDASNIEPQVAFPHLPENTKGISEIKEDIKIDQAFIGSWQNAPKII